MPNKHWKATPWNRLSRGGYCWDGFGTRTSENKEVGALLAMGSRRRMLVSQGAATTTKSIQTTQNKNHRKPERNKKQFWSYFYTPLANFHSSLTNPPVCRSVVAMKLWVEFPESGASKVHLDVPGSGNVHGILKIYADKTNSAVLRFRSAFFAVKFKDKVLPAHATVQSVRGLSNHSIVQIVPDLGKPPIVKLAVQTPKGRVSASAPSTSSLSQIVKVGGKGISLLLPMAGDDCSGNDQGCVTDRLTVFFPYVLSSLCYV